MQANPRVPPSLWTVDGITFEAELSLDVAPGRIIWLQQWIAGAFDYLDNSILAAVVRGVSDLSISRAWYASWRPKTRARARGPTSPTLPRTNLALPTTMHH